MRFRYRITFIDPTIHKTTEKNMFQEDVPVEYQQFRATDGTPEVTFTGSCPAHEFQIDDIVNGEMLDTRYPTVIGNPILESRRSEPALLVAPEPIQLPIEPPTPASKESQDWRYALVNGQFLAPIDVFQMAQAFVRLEARVKELESSK
jgi:hypothetical protein